MDDQNPEKTIEEEKANAAGPPGEEAAGGARNNHDSNQSRTPPASSESRTIELMESIRSLAEEQLALTKLSHSVLGKVFDTAEKHSEQSVARLQRAIFIELTMLYDSLQQAMAWVRATSAPNPEAVLDRFNTLQIELLEILARRDVRPFDEKSKVLDRRLCRTVKTVSTTEPSENNAVLNVSRDGFFWGEQVLRPEEVTIKKYQPDTSVKGE